MILEGIVTTLNDDGGANIAPMGPRVEPGMNHLILRPFRTSTTYRNLKARGTGVFHVTDDVLLLARSAIGAVGDAPLRPATRIPGWVLTDCCRYQEFQVADVDEREDRVGFLTETVYQETVRDFFGWNRAKHAILETAILATRIQFSPLDPISSELERYRVIVGKTGGPDELLAFKILEGHILSVARQRDHDRERSACPPA